MCNLYRMTKNKDEVAKWFDAIDDLAGANFGAEVFPGYPGAVVAEGRLTQMSWGFPLVLKGSKGQLLKPKPVNNARTDKLGSPFWRARARRCQLESTTITGDLSSCIISASEIVHGVLPTIRIPGRLLPLRLSSRATKSMVKPCAMIVTTTTAKLSPISAVPS